MYWPQPHRPQQTDGYVHELLRNGLTASRTHTHSPTGLGLTFEGGREY